jgi:carboxyl-terminal processing protease
MKNRILTLLTLSLLSTAVSAQSRPGSILELPKVEPFKITAGSSFSASGGQPAQARNESPIGESRQQIMNDLAEALSVISKNYVQKVKADELFKSAADGALKSLDPHSNYFDASEFGDLLDEEEGKYSGIGATIASYVNDGQTDTYVLSVTPNSPAERAGLRYGDKILSVNGEPVAGSGSDTVRDKVRGLEGSIARIAIERPGINSPLTLELKRSMVPEHTVADSYMINPGVGYIELSGGFDYNTFNEVNTAVNHLKRLGMQTLVLDIRGNPGGIMEEAVKVAEKFLPSGALIVTQRGRHPIDNHVWRSVNRSPETMPLVVLVDGGSASASEILAGALQDNDRALIVGERTFGKGLVQSVFDLPGSAGLTLTTARYYTPSGRSIQRDYSKTGLYDYYERHQPAVVQSSPEARTITDRKVYGGDGILPDELVTTPVLSNAQMSLLDPLFFFIRETAAARQNGRSPSILPATFSAENEAGRLLPEFEKFATARYPGLSSNLLQSEANFIKQRLVYDLTMATGDMEAAKRSWNRTDPQILKALEMLSKAGELAASASKIRQDNTYRPKPPLVSRARKKPAE